MMTSRKMIALACLLVLSCAGCQVELHSSLGEQAANEMMAVLLNRGIDAEKLAGKDNTWILMVEKNRVAAAVDILSELGYPKERYTSMGAVFEKKGMTSTPLEESARFIYALSQEISKTLSLIDGVVSVRTHIVLPKNSPFDENVVPSSAAVFIKCRDDKAISYNIPKIKQLVAGAIEGLTYDKVSVFHFTTVRDRPAAGAAETAAPPEPGEPEPGEAGSLMLPATIITLVLAAAGGGYLMWRRRSGKRGEFQLPMDPDDH